MSIISKRRTGKPNQKLYSTDMFHWSVYLNCVDCGKEETAPMFGSEETIEDYAKFHLCKACKRESVRKEPTK